MKCKAMTANKTKCKAQALKGGQYCFIHAPETGHARAAARKLGGENRHTPHFADASKLPKQIKTLADVEATATYYNQETIGMDNSIARNRLGVLFCELFLKFFEIGELEKRIQALEERRK